MKISLDWGKVVAVVERVPMGCDVYMVGGHVLTLEMSHDEAVEKWTRNMKQLAQTKQTGTIEP